MNLSQASPEVFASLAGFVILSIHDNTTDVIFAGGIVACLSAFLILLLGVGDDVDQKMSVENIKRFSFG